jgi:hypothetical protein
VKEYLEGFDHSFPKAVPGALASKACLGNIWRRIGGGGMSTANSRSDTRDYAFARGC